ncbi:MAG: cytochrome c oxidase assembly protein [Solirubrobacteraceae bacterium]
MQWSDWSLDPSLVYVVLAAALYLLGSRGRDQPRPLQAAAFVAGLLTIVIALDSPIDAYADKLFWVHMVQHILLLTVAPPLFLLGRPWPRMWRALPLGPRTRVARTLARGRLASPVRALARPMPAWILFNATVVGWHIPAAYDATLTNGTIHATEHAMFFFTGLLFWARVVDPGPLRPRLVWPVRIAYTAGAMVVGWILAITLVLLPHPIYSFYSALAVRPGHISALTDQQLAAGVMWVPGSLAYVITFLIGFYRWLEPDHTARPAPGAYTT